MVRIGGVSKGLKAYMCDTHITQEVRKHLFFMLFCKCVHMTSFLFRLLLCLPFSVPARN